MMTTHLIICNHQDTQAAKPETRTSSVDTHTVVPNTTPSNSWSSESSSLSEKSLWLERRLGLQLDSPSVRELFVVGLPKSLTGPILSASAICASMLSSNGRLLQMLSSSWHRCCNCPIRESFSLMVWLSLWMDSSDWQSFSWRKEISLTKKRQSKLNNYT